MARIARQAITESNTITIAKGQCPVLSNSKVSRLNVEKVLKPPHKPTNKNIFVFWLSIVFENLNTTSANTKQLIIFASNVAIGKYPE